ncbi:Coiled-coil domain-containing protein 61 [Acipenser ruthenus]|uniref:Coiled-coil domain-containing protein 61 n=1 Tax=Acipenser ruthenus TaxID=7906 RepID=A0A444U9J4_ACIRT|nr:Coiled-coil domain-containing protein 61 [Acipenser ruthenus]
MTPLQRSGSSLSRGGGEGEGRRSVSQERERSQGRAGSAGPVRSVSRERRERWAGGDRERSRERSGSTGPRPVPPRVSPSGTRVPRFDPTAYVKDKEQRQREAERRSQRKVRRDLLATPPSSERGRPRSRETRPLGRRVGSVGRGRSSSVESARSRRSSASSLAELEELAQPLPSRKAGRPLGSVLWNAPGLPRRGSRGPKKRMSSTPTRKNRSSDKGSAGVHEEPGHTSLAMTPDPSAQLQEGPDPDPSISRVPESDPSISRVPESDPSISRVPESDPSISRVPESDPSISRVPESDPSISEGRVCLTRSDPDCEP